MIIVSLLGSSSADSLTRQGLQAVADQIRAAGLRHDCIDLRDEYRALQDMTHWNEPPAQSQTEQLRARIARADAIVLASPVYHGSFSGLLKNALDHLAGDAFAHLPVGVLAAGGGPRSASVACDHLRSVIRAMGGWSTPTHVGMSYADIVDGRPVENLVDRAAEMVGELRDFMTMRNQLRQAA